jgi:pyruvate ferredoxin oxidoreductase gamma subunit
MSAYVRAAKAAIHERGIIKHPDLVIVADDSLVPIRAAGVMQGITEDTALLIHSSDKAEIWKERLNFSGLILTLPAVDIEDALEERFIGASCAGAAASLSGVISKNSLEEAIVEELESLGPETVDKNIEKALEAYDLIATQAHLLKEGSGISTKDYERPEWIDLPFEDARISAPIIHGAVTSEAMKTGLWRSIRPVIDYDACNRCWWLCSTYCPDGAISLNNEGYPEIDYEHCKGCMICMANCPPHAISAIAENKKGNGKT